MHFIYKITNTINNKIYIGQTNNPNLRWSQHKSNPKHNRGNQLITRALIKYGFDFFTFEVIASCLNQEDVDFMEETIIYQYDSRNPDKGYNVDFGGNTSPRTPEIIEKTSKSLKKYYETHSNWNKGGSLTDEWKMNISKSSIGKLGTNTGKEFDENWKLRISKSLTDKPQISKRRFSTDIEKEICRLYLEEEKSMYSLGKEFNCQRNLISDILKRNNVSIRKSNYTGHCNGCNIFSLKEELEICSLYQEGKFSRSELARKFNCGKTTVRDILIRNNIKLK